MTSKIQSVTDICQRGFFNQVKNGMMKHGHGQLSQSQAVIWPILPANHLCLFYCQLLSSTMYKTKQKCSIRKDINKVGSKL